MSMPLVSIVMGYYNRKELLKTTLKTIEKSKHKDNVEIVIVDDASRDEERLEDLNFDLNIKLIRIKPEEKTWINPSVAYNIAFKNATADRIIIQNPECLHLGDIIDDVLTKLHIGTYLSFSCYSIDGDTLKKVQSVDIDGNYVNKLKSVIPLKNSAVRRDGENGWYNHPNFKPSNLHFCTAISKSDLDIIGGFNEEFANGIAYEDNEFLHRVKKKLYIKTITNKFVVHQYHGATNYSNIDLVRKNSLIAQRLIKIK